MGCKYERGISSYHVKKKFLGFDDLRSNGFNEMCTHKQKTWFHGKVIRSGCDWKLIGIG